MKAERIRDEFELLAQKLGYSVRYEKGDFRGDACRINSEKVIIINKLIPISHQNYAFSRIFAEENLESINVLPVLRMMMEEILETEPESGSEGAENA